MTQRTEDTTDVTTEDRIGQELIETAMALPSVYANRVLLMRNGAMTKIVFFDQLAPSKGMTAARSAIIMDNDSLNSFRQALIESAEPDTKK